MMKRELESRLIKFSVDIYHLCESFKKTEYSFILSKQLLRSSSSAALNYGEAQGAETRKDFIHKIGLVLKELRESYVNLRIINDVGICNNQKTIDDMIRENNELISIFFATLKTSKSNEKNQL
jgi:four helix bundle protein